MATPAQILELRQKAGVATNDDQFGDNDALGAMIDQIGLSKAVANIWERKAASLATLVDTSESGSSRKMGDMYKNALAMAARYDEDDVVVPGGNLRTTRSAERES